MGTKVLATFVVIFSFFAQSSFVQAGTPKVTEEDIVYARLLGNDPVDRGATDGSPDGTNGPAKPAEGNGGTYAMPDFLVIASFLPGISMAFTVRVTAYKMKGYLKRWLLCWIK